MRNWADFNAMTFMSWLAENALLSQIKGFSCVSSTNTMTRMSCPPIPDVAISAGIWLAWPACDVGTRRALWDGVGNDGRTDKEMLAARTMNMVKSATTIEAAVAAMEVAGSKVRAAEYFHKRQEASKSTVEKAWRAFFAAEDKVKSLSVRA